MSRCGLLWERPSHILLCSGSMSLTFLCSKGPLKPDRDPEGVLEIFKPFLPSLHLVSIFIDLDCCGLGWEFGKKSECMAKTDWKASNLFFRSPGVQLGSSWNSFTRVLWEFANEFLWWTFSKSWLCWFKLHFIHRNNACLPIWKQWESWSTQACFYANVVKSVFSITQSDYLDHL